MSGVEIILDDADLRKAEIRLNGLVDGLLDDVGYAAASLVESQTRRRIEDERTAPDGAPWPLWSERYKKSRHKGNTLLRGEGDLVDSISGAFDGTDEVSVGSNLVYAAIHQFGGTDDMAPGPAGIPARPYLGLSGENADEIRDMVQDIFAERLS